MEDLADAADMPLTLTASTTRRFDQRVEATAYQVVADAVRPGVFARAELQLNASDDGYRSTSRGADPVFPLNCGPISRTASWPSTERSRSGATNKVIGSVWSCRARRDRRRRAAPARGPRPAARRGTDRRSRRRPRTPTELLRAVAQTGPDVAIVDIRMPPTRTDEGLVAAEAIGRRLPEVGVLVLSHYLEPAVRAATAREHPRASATCSRSGSRTGGARRCAPSDRRGRVRARPDDRHAADATPPRA